MKIAVGVLAFITLLKSIHALYVAEFNLIPSLINHFRSAVVWINFIVYFGALEEAILLSYTTWYQAGTPLMVGHIFVGCTGPIINIFH